MDDIDTLRQDVRAGRISADRVVDLAASQQRQLQSLQQQLQLARERIEELVGNWCGLAPAAEIGYLGFIVGLSFGKGRLLVPCFENRTLKEAQADALLYRLARHWEREVSVLCTFLAGSPVVHADETSWILESVWAF